MNKVDILAFGAHPDDIELACSGTVIKQVAAGSKLAIVDLTRGELGTRGSADLRDQESAKAAEILGVVERRNLRLADGFFEVNEETLHKVVEMIRHYQPKIILCNAPWDRHPDHGRAAELVKRANFLSGLRKVESELDGEQQEAWRASAVYMYIQDRYMDPDFVVDVSDVWEKRMTAVKAYASQFYDPNSKEPESPISSKFFMDYLDARAMHFGRFIGAEYAEGFMVERSPGVNDLNDLL
jgi:bacillithiol biosynthesis deacetylase BshB1